MKTAAARAIADIVAADELREDYIIPSVFNREVAAAVAAAVADEARAQRRRRRQLLIGVRGRRRAPPELTDTAGCPGARCFEAVGGRSGRVGHVCEWLRWLGAVVRVILLGRGVGVRPRSAH